MLAGTSNFPLHFLSACKKENSHNSPSLIEFCCAQFVQFQKKEKMAQAQVDNQKVITLSKYTTVKVTETGQIEFTVTPAKEFMPKTYVYLTTPAWISFCNEARSKIKNCLDLGIGNSWMFHPNSKYVEVTTSGQVFLQTFNRKGNMMKEHSIFLSPEEWENLDNAVASLNMDLDKVVSNRQKSSSHHVSLMSTYSWKFEGMKGDQDHHGFLHYMDKETATAAAEKYKLSCLQELGPMKLEVQMQKPLHPFNFLVKVYFTVLYRITKSVGVCVGASSDLKECLCDNFDTVKQIADDKLMIEVFQRCWQRMKLATADAEMHMKCFKVLYQSLETQAAVANKIHEIGVECNKNTECILVSAVCADMDLDGTVQDYIKNRNMLPDVVPKKKNKKSLKLDIDMVDTAE